MSEYQEQLKEKYYIYSHFIKNKQDKDGFIVSDECDSLLFSGLVGCLPDISVDIDAARGKEDGLWLRRPKDIPCYPDHSASSISRDMLVGLAWYAYKNRRLDISEGVIKYAFKHWFIMGEAKDWKTKIGRCFLTPGLLATFAWISYTLGGPSRPWLRWIPIWMSERADGYEAHIAVLHALLRRKLTWRDDNKEMLKFHADRQPKNPLFLYAAGYDTEAMKVLLTRKWWPHDRLPSAKERKEQWLPQRDFSDDWRPTKQDKVHPGGDFLFCAALILNKL